MPLQVSEHSLSSQQFPVVWHFIERPPDCSVQGKSHDVDGFCFIRSRLDLCSLLLLFFPCSWLWLYLACMSMMLL